MLPLLQYCSLVLHKIAEQRACSSMQQSSFSQTKSRIHAISNYVTMMPPAYRCALVPPFPPYLVANAERTSSYTELGLRVCMYLARSTSPSFPVSGRLIDIF